MYDISYQKYECSGCGDRLTIPSDVDSVEGRQHTQCVNAPNGYWHADSEVARLRVEVARLTERVNKAEAACRALMRFEDSMDGNEDSDDRHYWPAVRLAREAVGDYRPEWDEVTPTGGSNPT